MNNNKFKIISCTLIKSINPARITVDIFNKPYEITLECWTKPSSTNSFRSENILTITNNNKDMGVILSQELIFKDDSNVYNYLIKLKTKATASNCYKLLFY